MEKEINKENKNLQVKLWDKHNLKEVDKLIEDYIEKEAY